MAAHLCFQVCVSEDQLALSALWVRSIVMRGLDSVCFVFEIVRRFQSVSKM